MGTFLIFALFCDRYWACIFFMWNKYIKNLEKKLRDDGFFLKDRLACLRTKLDSVDLTGNVSPSSSQRSKWCKYVHFQGGSFCDPFCLILVYH